jgi:hypothetical protein
MTHHLLAELVRALDDARVNVIKRPLPVNGESPRAALLDALNRLLTKKEIGHQ